MLEAGFGFGCDVLLVVSEVVGPELSPLSEHSVVHIPAVPHKSGFGFRLRSSSSLVSGLASESAGPAVPHESEFIVVPFPELQVDGGPENHANGINDDHGLPDLPFRISDGLPHLECKDGGSAVRVEIQGVMESTVLSTMIVTTPTAAGILSQSV